MGNKKFKDAEESFSSLLALDVITTSNYYSMVHQMIEKISEDCDETYENTYEYFSKYLKRRVKESEHYDLGFAAELQLGTKRLLKLLLNPILNKHNIKGKEYENYNIDIDLMMDFISQRNGFYFYDYKLDEDKKLKSVVLKNEMGIKQVYNYDGILVKLLFADDEELSIEE